MASPRVQNTYIVTELNLLTECFSAFLQSKHIPESINISLNNASAAFIHDAGVRYLGIFNSETGATYNPDASSSIWNAAFSNQRCIDIMETDNLSDDLSDNSHYQLCFGDYVGKDASDTPHGLGFHVLLVGQGDIGLIYTYEANLEDFFPPVTTETEPS